MSPSAESYRLLLVFVDGLGLARRSASNPLTELPTPALHRLLGGPLSVESLQEGPELVLAALDATLGVAGLPQSVTGQATMLTGVNCAELLGRHVTGFVGKTLERVISERSLFRELGRRGLSATFANAYAPAAKGSPRRRIRSVTTLSMAAADLPLRGVPELLRGEAVTWDIERDRFAKLAGKSLPRISARQAGAHLATITAAHDFTLFETFFSDLAGHRRFGLTAEDAVRRLDGLIEGVRSGAGTGPTLLLTSDHGNLEDSTTRVHTRNPVPFLALGPAAGHFQGMVSLREVTPRIVSCLEEQARPASS